MSGFVRLEKDVVSGGCQTDFKVPPDWSAEKLRRIINRRLASNYPVQRQQRSGSRVRPFHQQV